MKITIDIFETKAGDIALRMRTEAGPATKLEAAYADGIVDHLKDNIPVIGKKLGGRGLIGGKPEGQ